MCWGRIGNPKGRGWLRIATCHWRGAFARLAGFMSTLTFAVLPGDYIGPEVMKAALRVLSHVAKQEGLTLQYQHGDVGGAGIDNHGKALPDSTLELCRKSDAILFGSVGGPKWEKLPPKEQPERAALLPLRKAFTLFANIRPGLLYKDLVDASPLKVDRIPNGIDIVCIRELTGGIYFGQPKSTTVLENGEQQAVDTMIYKTSEIERIAEVAAVTARARGKRVTSVDKANVLETSVLWRRTVTEYFAKRHPDLALSHMYVDNAAMQLARDPNQFDVLFTENMFGDILSDLAAGLIGGMGMAPSADIGDTCAVFQPSHGTAPDIAGKGIANPIATILSLALMLDWLDHPETKDAVKRISGAVEAVLADPANRTRDLGGTLSTTQMGDLVAAKCKSVNH